MNSDSSTTSSRCSQRSRLLKSALFSKPVHYANPDERALLSYERAKAIANIYEMTVEDVVTLSSKFWEIHNDPVMVVDGSAMTIVGIQYNLCVGTIGPYAARRPELRPLVEDLLRFRKYGQLLMTEVGHGLDISNIETTATLLSTGGFILNSPTPDSAKYMPPTVPAGSPCIGIVFARLFVEGEFRGHRPFLVPLNDGKQMCSGIECKLLPYRGGTNPIMHAMTTFTNVELPASALLGSLAMPADLHANLAAASWRLVVGTMSFSCLAVPMLRCVAAVGALYSRRRHIGAAADRKPIIVFGTQQGPVLAAVADAYVMRAFQSWAIECFCDATLDGRVRRGLAAIFKGVIVQHMLRDAVDVGNRCGAQGLFVHNQLGCLYNESRGLAIAEGDILAISIRLIIELLLGRYAMPPAADPSSLLARHESGVLSELRSILLSAPSHRSECVNRLVLPRCQLAMEAIGHRMAYEAARAQGVHPVLLDLYLANALRLDAGWYAQHVPGLGWRAQLEMEARATAAAVPLLDEFLSELREEMGDECLVAPIVSGERWAEFVRGMRAFGGSAHVDVLERPGSGRGGSEEERGGEAMAMAVKARL